MLATYLTLLKTIQYIVPPPQPELRELTRRWLARSLSQARIGILPNSFSSEGFTIETASVVNFPHGSTARVFTELSPDVPAEIRDSLVLSSCYLSPLLVIGDSLWQRFAPYAFWILRSSRVPDEKEVYRALREARDACLSLFRFSAEAHHTIHDYLSGEIGRESLEILLHKRRIQASQEAERLFSRWSSSPSGPPLFFLADPLSLIGPWLTSMKRDLIAQLPWDDFASAGFGIAVGVVLLPEILKRQLRPAATSTAVAPRHRSNRHEPRPPSQP